jgi:hypothetical protein
VLDVRPAGEFARGTIAGAQHAELAASPAGRARDYRLRVRVSAWKRLLILIGRLMRGG